MLKLLKIILPIALIVGGFLIYRQMAASRPEARFAPPRAASIFVEAQRLMPTDYQVTIESRGLVRPRTTSSLIPEVSGRIVEISESFLEGRFFEEDEVLVKIDDRDYVAAVRSAEAGLAQMRLNLEEEKARVEQARIDWERVNPGRAPEGLVTRTPQLLKAEADVASAEAQVDRAQRNLDRTEIRAPYNGRIRSKRVDIGQYVTPGTMLAEVFASDFLEVRLPLRNQDLAFVELPEVYADQQTVGPKPKVTLFGDYGGQTYSWEGRIVRTEATIDASSRELYVVAQVNDPFSQADTTRPPLKIGLFVEAMIEGNVLENVFPIPTQAVLRGNEVVFLSEEGTVDRREMNVIWTDEANVVVAEDVEAQEIISVTPLPFTANGASVSFEIEGEAPRMVGRGPGAGGGRPGAGQGGPGQRPEGAGRGVEDRRPKPEQSDAKSAS
ncbi:MAG: efflux RND transporter periplasmic adaptor subunit [Opitutales bacterium]|nr:efflux RND transporter periplasmic adaptor subunit [Opitutales bacterium]NRA28180.1 efflux RND transporter periplasmic adaptor subunit [Opitutales bacterium]